MSMVGLRKLYDQLKESHRRRAALDKELDDLFFNEFADCISDKNFFFGEE